MHILTVLNLATDRSTGSRIIVLTYNRPRSLHRLLRSLEAAHYTFPTNNPAWDIILEIRVDGGGGQQGDTVKNVARE